MFSAVPTTGAKGKKENGTKLQKCVQNSYRKRGGGSKREIVAPSIYFEGPTHRQARRIIQAHR